MKLPSEEKIWMNYYPKEIQNLQVPNCSLSDYLKINMNNLDDTCIKFYGENITYKNLFEASKKNTIPHLKNCIAILCGG